MMNYLYICLVLQFLGFAFIFLSSDVSSECEIRPVNENININRKSQNENVNEDMNDNN